MNKVTSKKCSLKIEYETNPKLIQIQGNISHTYNNPSIILPTFTIPNGFNTTIAVGNSRNLKVDTLV